MTSENAQLALNAFGDIVGAAFAGEAEAVVFLPNSGDVLISALAQWQRLCAEASGNASPAASLAPEQDLRSTLLHLGAKIDGRFGA